MTETFLRMRLDSLSSRQKLLEQAVELLVGRIEALEGEEEPDEGTVRLPKFSMKAINARLEGDDIA